MRGRMLDRFGLEIGAGPGSAQGPDLAHRADGGLVQSASRAALPGGACRCARRPGPEGVDSGRPERRRRAAVTSSPRGEGVCASRRMRGRPRSDGVRVFTCHLRPLTRLLPRGEKVTIVRPACRPSWGRRGPLRRRRGSRPDWRSPSPAEGLGASVARPRRACPEGPAPAPGSAARGWSLSDSATALRNSVSASVVWPRPARNSARFDSTAGLSGLSARAWLKAASASSGRSVCS